MKKFETKTIIEKITFGDIVKIGKKNGVEYKTMLKILDDFVEIQNPIKDFLTKMEVKK